MKEKRAARPRKRVSEVPQPSRATKEEITVPDEQKSTTETGPGGPQSFYELYTKHMDTVRDAHVETYKRIHAAYTKYAESMQNALKEISQQTCAQMYVDGLQAAMGRVDAAQRYLQTSNDAHLAFQRRATEAGRALVSELT